MSTPLTDEQLAEMRERAATTSPTLLSHEQSAKRIITEDVPALLAEVKRLKEQVEKIDGDLDEEIKNRDQAHELLDSFAYTIAPIEAIGEHSSGNDPWENALDMLTPAAEVERLRELRWPMWHEIAAIVSADISRWPWGPRSHRAIKRRLANAANRLIRDEQVTP